MAPLGRILVIGTTGNVGRQAVKAGAEVVRRWALDHAEAFR